jgi:myo-inositol-1(or 4)-monophosphatase
MIGTPEQRWLNIAWRAITAGERELVKRFRLTTKQALAFKAHQETVTEADTASNKAIIKVLRKLTPHVPILSEEGGTTTRSKALRADIAWVLDPLDGTNNYAMRLPLWGISLALVRRGGSILGAISLPVLRARFHAVLGQGAWIGHDRLHVSDQKKLSESIGFLCYGYARASMHKGLSANRFLSMKSRTTRRLSAAVVDTTWVAMGHADYAVLHGIRPWDMASGALLVREAGGTVCTPTGEPWKLGDPDVVLSTPALAKDVVRCLRRT